MVLQNVQIYPRDLWSQWLRFWCHWWWRQHCSICLCMVSMKKKFNFKLMKLYISPQKFNRILCFRYANSVEEACYALLSFTHMKILRSTYVKSLSNYVYHKKKILRNDVIEYWVKHRIEFLSIFYVLLSSNSFYSVLL